MGLPVKEMPLTWQVIATALGGILLTVIAWETSRAVEALRDIEKSLAIAVQRLDEHERRLGNLETLYLKREQ